MTQDHQYIGSQEFLTMRTQPVEFMLTAEQMSYIRSILPRFFSLQESRKPTKRQKKDSVSKILDYQTKIGTQQSLKEIDQQSKTKRPRPKKVDRFLEEEAIRKNKPVPLSERITEQQTNKCINIISQLKKNPSSWPFLEPVDPIKLSIPDYFDIIKQPMDLSTIQKNVKTFQYSTMNQFHGDINKIWLNSYRYNQKGSEIYKLTIEMQKCYKKIMNKISELENSATAPMIHYPAVPAVKKPKEKYNVIKPPKIKNQTQQMSISQKRQLCQDIKKLPKEHLSGIWTIVANGRQSNQLQFDIDQLEVDKTWKLQRYVRQTLDKLTIKKPESREQHQPHEVLSAESSFLLESESEN